MAVSDGLWVEVTPSEHAHERAALNFLRERMPDREPFRVWTNFTFQAEDGRRYEVDLLAVTPTEVFLVEIKSHPNRIDGDAGTWTWTRPDGSRQSFDNPLRLAEAKAKKLKSLLLHQDALKDPRLNNRRGPDGKPMRAGFYVRALVFLSDPTLKVGLDELGRSDVFGPDVDPPDAKQTNDLPGIVARLTDVPANARNRIDRPLSTAIAKAIDQAGIRQSQALRQAGHYRLDELITDGDGWQDFLAQQPLTKDTRRIRLYLTSRAQTEEERYSLARAAEREYRFLQGIDHPGIERPLEVLPNPQGPALVFPHDPQALRLDHYLDERRDDLDLYERIELVRQLAETLRAAHRAGLYHRALAPQHVTVTPSKDGPKLKIRDWQAAARELTAMSTSIRQATGTSHVARLVTEQAHVYVAPEVIRLGESNPRAADMWSLGAVSYLILTGEPPASDPDGLYATLKEHESLTLASSGMDAPDASLDEVIRYATRAVATDRFISVDEFLEYLDVALDELTTVPAPDPLDAKRGDVIGDWQVLKRFGVGSTSVVLQVERDGRTEVLKVARDEDHAARLRDEAEVLEQLEDARSPAIVRAYGLEALGGRTALRLEAAYTTLSRLLEQEGPLSIDRLERFGQDLLDALTVLEQEGIAHRDIKPDNLGVIERGKNKERRLVLFDFSLSRADATNLNAGTAAYLDPFLSERDAKRWDLQAERYAATVTLHEMATGQRPQWGDGSTDPVLIDRDAGPTLFLDVVDPSIRGPLANFLTRGLARDPDGRFDTAADMRRAFDQLFAEVDAPAIPTDEGVDPADIEVAGITADTALTDLGLAPRIVNVLERLGTLTAGDLARVPPHELSRLSGVGASIRRQVADLADRLRRALDDVEIAEDGDVLSVDKLINTLVPKGPTTDESRIALRAFLGLVPTPVAAWPSQRQVTEQTELDRAVVTGSLGAARDRWRKRPELTAIRAELAALLDARDGVAGGDELATALLATRGSLEEEPVRTCRARAVVRAALETEATLKQPRFVHRRIGEVLLVALDGPHTSSDDEVADHDADALFDLAAELGEMADKLASEQPLPSPDRVVAQLRAVPTPPGSRPMTDARLVRLAAAASSGAAVSSRLELYPIGMDPVRAVAEARGALLARGGLTIKDVTARVTARFPRAAKLPKRPQLDQVLTDAGTGLSWQAGDATAGRYIHPDRGGVLATSYLTGTSSDSTTYASPDERELARQEVDDRLDRIVRDGGFLALTVARRDLEQAASAVTARAGAVHVDLDTWLIEEMRAAAKAANARWDKLLDADTDRDGANFRHVRALVGRAMPAVRDRLANHGPIVVATGLGLLARYDQLFVVEELRDQLTRERSRQAATLQGLIVLVPGVDPGTMPMLDGQPIPVITANQWAHLPSAWLSNTGAAA